MLPHSHISEYFASHSILHALHSGDGRFRARVTLPGASVTDPARSSDTLDDLPIAASESELNTQPLQPKIPGKGGTEWCGGGRGLSAARRTGTYPLTYSYGDVLAQTTESSFAVPPSPPRYLLAFQRPCNKSCTARRRR